MVLESPLSSGNTECILNSEQTNNFSIFFFHVTQNNLNSTASAPNLATTLQEQLLMCFSNCFCKSERSLKFCIITSCVSMKFSEAWAFSEQLNIYSSGTEICKLQAVRVCKPCETRTKSNFSCLSALLKNDHILLEINHVLTLKKHFIFSR